jgi:hypothetical protein
MAVRLAAIKVNAFTGAPPAVDDRTSDCYLGADAWLQSRWVSIGLVQSMRVLCGVSTNKALRLWFAFVLRSVSAGATKREASGGDVLKAGGDCFSECFPCNRQRGTSVGGKLLLGRETTVSLCRIEAGKNPLLFSFSQTRSQERT